MENDGAPCTTPPSSPWPKQEDTMKTHSATPNSGEQSQPATSGIPSEDDEQTSRSNAASQPVITEETEFNKGVGDMNVLSEVRSSLQTMSTGMNELVTTVQDLLGLSESDNDTSDSDCSYNSAGSRKFSWTKFKNRARHRRQRRRQLTKTRQIPTVGSEDEFAKDNESLSRPRGIILAVRECNYEQFQSRPAGDGQYLHCVDALIADDSLKDEMQDFEAVVDMVNGGEITSWKPGEPSKRTADSNIEVHSSKWIRRIRVNSSAVMKILQQVCTLSEDFGRGPMVFYRPFQLLVQRHEDMKAQLAKMRRPSAGSTDEEATATVPAKKSEPGTIQGDNLDDATRELCEDTNAVDELACFVDFMEKRIMPDARRYENPTSPEAQSIRYEDLWYLYKPGGLVYAPRGPWNSDALIKSSSLQSFFRIIYTRLTETSLNYQPFYVTDPDEDWSVVLYYVDYDGASYRSAHLMYRIPFFRGDKKVRDLAIYPVSYLKDRQIMAQARSDGVTRVSLIARRFGFYSGWTQTRNALGTVLKYRPENKPLSPEHIEGDILVDYQETFNAFPTWQLQYIQQDRLESLASYNSLVGIEDHAILEWEDPGQTKSRMFERRLGTDCTEYDQMRMFLEKNPIGLSTKSEHKVPTGEMLALVPRQFFAYAVLERKFVQLDVRFVRSAEREANDKAFKNLELNPGYKRLILALVKSHFDKIETEKRTNVEIETQDLIRGKGKGVVILLHGVPGVGKTATAEAVALKWNKPLFPITCGDLGYTAESLEKSLNEIFRLAHLWGCVLLLDEADVFITRRERHDLKRNALVSAFLRVLEYYNGIMFLTTNRAGVLDEAVKSRVHLNLHYDHLNEEQTVAIFKQNIQRLRDIEKQRNSEQSEQVVVLHKEIVEFAKDHFNQGTKNHGFGRWNGRQIKNAFLIASSLAHYDDEDESELGDIDDLAEPNRKVQKQLGRKQFEIVAETTLLYDKYRESVYSGKSDDYMAAQREERAAPTRPVPRSPDRLRTPSTSFT